MLQFFLQWLIWAVDEVWPVPILVIGCCLAWHLVRVAARRAMPGRRQRRGALAIPRLADVTSPLWWIIPVIICFPVTLAAALLAENAVVRSVNLLGHQTRATVIQRKPANVEVNFRKTDRLTLRYETADGRMVEAGYLSSSYPYYPIRDSYRLPSSGEIVDIKYLPHRPSVFIILQD